MSEQLVARFSLRENELNANFTLQQESIPAIFKINASGTTWGSISGNINNQTDLINALNAKQSVLTAGDNINIQGDVISAVDTTYTAGTGIDITNGVISNTLTSAVWGNIEGTLSNQLDLQNALNAKQNYISDLSTIRENAGHGESAYNTIATYGNIVTHNVSEFATSAQGATADTALQPNDNISELVNDVGYITSASVGDGKLAIQVNSVDLGEFTANQFTDTTINITMPTDLGDLTNNAKYLKNTATATDAISVYGTSNSSWTNGINIGAGSLVSSNNGVAIGIDASADINAVAYGRDADAGTRGTAIGAYAKTSYDTGIAIGCWNANTNNAKSTAKGAYQFGVGTNNTARTLNIGWYDDSVHPSTFRNYQLLDGNTGLIPDARISTNIARTLDMTTADNNLQDQIDVLKARGRFLALWNCATGLAESNPPESPYTYHAGDYFIVGVVSTATPAVNYKPDGSSYTTGVASTTLETSVVDIDDVYYYDGTTWKLQVNTQKTVSFVNIAGSPYDNTALGNALNAKADISSLATVATSGDYGDLINTPAINDATLTIEVNGTSVGTFTANASSNATANITVPTDTNDLTNGAGYITGITSSDVTTALGYTPYDVTNPSGYISGITSGDVTTALGYTPYDSTNPNGYISGITSSDVTTALGYTPLSNSTKYGADLSYSSNTLQLLDQDGNSLGSSVTIQSSPDIDGITITKNSDDELQTIAVIDQNNISNGIKTWTGTKAEYDAIVTKDVNTLYNITDDTDITLTLLELLFPVGAIYTGTMANCPLQALGVGTWQLKTSRFLVDKYSNGADWWELYSDGWCRQGGVSSALSGYEASTTVTLHKAMVDTNYTLTGVVYRADGGSYADQFLVTATKSTTQFIVYANWAGSANYNKSQQMSWVAEGYTSETTQFNQWERTA